MFGALLVGTQLSPSFSFHLQMDQQAPVSEPTSVPTNEQLRVMADDKKRFVEEEYDVGLSFAIES